MKTQIKNQIQTVVLAATIVMAVSWGIAFGDDFAPPSYRGNPLSVQAEWQLLAGTNFLSLTQSNWVDDADPTTTLSPVPFSNQVQQVNGNYQFQLPNWIDQLQIKYMRVQLTWEQSLLPPVNIFSQAMDGANSINGVITFTSPVTYDASGIKAHQYIDFTFQPNPDFERINVQMQPNSLLTQVVVDTVSTVPEPATITLLMLGGLVLSKIKRI